MLEKEGRVLLPFSHCNLFFTAALQSFGLSGRILVLVIPQQAK